MNRFRNILRSIATFSLFAIAATSLADAQSLPETVGGETSESSGKAEYAWPQDPPQALSIAMAWKTAPEEPPFQVFRIAGAGLVIDMLSVSPFVMDEKSMTNGDWPGSVVLYDSCSQSGMLSFTKFAKDAFLPKVDAESIAGYARSLVSLSNPDKGIQVEIVIPPSELDRRAAMLTDRPLFLTWRMSRGTSSFQRTDYFFRLDDGSILVASVIANPEEEPAVRAAASNVLRFGSMEFEGNATTK